MSRKQFIESHGATCRNWMWSWSFVNVAEKFVIFGAWDVYEEGNKTLILGEDWGTSRRGKKQPGYEQSREHIRLIEDEGYLTTPTIPRSNFLDPFKFHFSLLCESNVNLSLPRW